MAIGPYRHRLAQRCACPKLKCWGMDIFKTYPLSPHTHTHIKCTFLPTSTLKPCSGIDHMGAGGGLLTVATEHAKVPALYFKGRAKGADSSWQAGRLKVYCTDASVQPFTLPPLPISSSYTPQLYYDASNFDPYAQNRPSTPGTEYNVR